MRFLKLFHIFLSLCLAWIGLSVDGAVSEAIIVSTNDSSQAHYWQSVLNDGNTDTRQYIVVHEDWDDGADNGLGSLYAFMKADQFARDQLQLNLKEVMATGGTVSLFHCAGMGKRLYPLTASEYNNKSAVKIPGKATTQTILDLVLQHSISLTTMLKGRLNVFWGDQIFIPSEPLTAPKEHVNIFAKVGTFPTEDEWHAKNLHQYGLLIQSSLSTKLVEKTTYPNLVAMVSDSETLPSIGVSLGSFSISAAMLEELLQTFDDALAVKKGKLNTDYHFWMPLTWPKDAYTDFMVAKGESREAVLDVYERMQGIKSRLQSRNNQPLFGVQNVGDAALWLDFGTVKSYYKNLIALLGNETLSTVFGIDRAQYYDPENNNLVINCNIDKIDAKNCVLINVNAKTVVATEVVLINVNVGEFIGNQSLGYNIREHGQLSLEKGEIRADVMTDQVAVYSFMDLDPKVMWDVILDKNGLSFEELYNLTK